MNHGLFRIICIILTIVVVPRSVTAQPPPEPVEPVPVTETPEPVTETPPPLVETPPEPSLTAPPLPPQPVLPAPVTPPPMSPAPEVTASDEDKELPVAGYKKGFFIQTPDGSSRLVVGMRVQTRFTFEHPDEGEASGEFSIPRARLQMSGHVFTPNLIFYIQGDFGKGATPTLKDGFIEYAVVPSWFHITAGQFKKPFSRQQLTSSTKLIMVDRSPLDKEYNAGRDIGVSLNNNWKKSPGFEYALAIFNGSGDKPKFDEESGTFSNIPEQLDPVIVSRVGGNFGDIKGFEEADFTNNEFGGSINANGQAKFNVDEDDMSEFAVGGDLMLKTYGVTFHAEVLAGFEQNGALWDNQRFKSIGLMAGLGYMVLDRLQPGVRFSRILRPDDEGEVEFLGGLSVFVFKHNFKAQLDGGPHHHRTHGRQDDRLSRAHPAAASAVSVQRSIAAGRSVLCGALPPTPSSSDSSPGFSRPSAP